MVSPSEWFKTNTGVIDLKDVITASGIEHYYILDSDGHSIMEQGTEPENSQLLTAMFATIITAAETSFCEMGIMEDVTVTLEAPNSRRFLIFKLHEDLIVALGIKEDEEQTKAVMKELKQNIREMLIVPSVTA